VQEGGNEKSPYGLTVRALVGEIHTTMSGLGQHAG
jgi:hypothetical protein